MTETEEKNLRPIIMGILHVGIEPTTDNPVLQMVYDSISFRQHLETMRALTEAGLTDAAREVGIKPLKTSQAAEEE